MFIRESEIKTWINPVDKLKGLSICSRGKSCYGGKWKPAGTVNFLGKGFCFVCERLQISGPEPHLVQKCISLVYTLFFFGVLKILNKLPTLKIN